LHLQGKRIRVIDGLELCTNLKVLYLYDNQIELIQNLDFANLLEYLYLQNNQIKQIPLLSMKSLRKLHLDDNEISVLSGLTECSQLVELSIARQRLPSFGSLQVEPQSLLSISYTLEVLDISGNGISKLSPFVTLYNLRRFTAEDNSIIDIPEIELIVALPHMTEASFSNNPCCKLLKYRDMVISASSDSLANLDGIPVPQHQHVAIKGLMDHRRKIGAMTRFQTSTSQEGSSYQPHELGSGSLEVGPEDSFVIRGHGQR
jgi:Leucine-rich repeat (LRR) protein